ncbi:MAG: amidohydrolase [Rhodothermales bacterium]
MLRLVKMLPLAPILVLLLLSGCAESSGDAPDLILHNGTIWTVDDAQPSAEAVAVRDGRFVAVGTDDDVLNLAGPGTDIIDLEGNFVTPGFIDTHVHFASAARFLEFNIMRTGTQDEFVERVEDVIRRLPEGEWILGGFWGAYDQWVVGSAGGEGREPFVPDISRIDSLTSNYPMFIRKFDNSAFAANSAALEAAGVDPLDPQAPGVTFERDENGTFTGIMTGDGVRDLFADAVPRRFTHERRLAQTRNALEEIRRHGVTAVSDMSDEDQLAIYRELLAQGELTARIDYRYPLDDWYKLAEQGIRRGSVDDSWIQLGGLKGHIDGIMGTSSARFFEPYDHDPENRGRWRRLMVDENGDFVEGQFLDYMLKADSAGLQLTVHAIGDEANHLLMNYLEELNARNGQRDRRFRLVHAQVIAPDDFRRLGELGIIAEVQPFHLSDDMRWMEERIGHERSKGAYAFKTINDNGAMLAFGSDWPGTSAAEYPINPMLGLFAAVSRQTVTGQPEAGWFSQERISIEEAIKAYTYNAAYAAFEEDSKGSITVGKLADLAVLSQNLLEIEPEKILETETLYTMVDGRMVYQKN